MGKFFVTWEIDIEEEDINTPLDAAIKAFNIVQERGTDANVFNVKNKETNETHMIDLNEYYYSFHE